jgi:ABC-type Zn uptake system ZnuABC Zn-binding protein ZnuA
VDANLFRSNLAALAAELAQLDAAQSRAAGRLGATPLLYSHPVYTYLQARYALNGRSVEWEPDAMPSEAQWRALRDLIEEHPARTMLWEAAPRPDVAARLAALDIEKRVYAPAANRPSTGDWLSVMRENASALSTLAGRAPGQPAATPRSRSSSSRSSGT